MKALVTGGGGFLGLYIVEQLIAAGHDVRVFCRSRYEALDRLGVETVQGDIRDADAVASACTGVDTVFHVAALPGIWGPRQTYYDINTLGTENVVAGCRQHGVGKLVYTSSPSVIYDGSDHCGADESIPYPDEFACAYPWSKSLAERHVLEANDNSFSTIALRPHLIWGPRDNHLIPRLVQRAKSGRLRRVGDGTNLISMSYVENVAHAHLLAAEQLAPGHPAAGRAYFINEPGPVSLWDWVDELLAAAGLPPVKKSISTSKAKKIGGYLEAIYQLLRLKSEPPMTRFLASQLAGSHYYDISAIQRDLGYSPLVTPAEGLNRMKPELEQLAAR